MFVRVTALALCVLAAGCGAKPGTAGTISDKSKLLAGSWRCHTPGGAFTPPDLSGMLYSFDTTFLADGAVRQTGVLRATFDGKPAEIQLIFRGKWVLDGDTLRQEYDYLGATSLKLDGEVVDHSPFNKMIIDDITHDPSKTIYETKLLSVDAREMVIEEADSERSTCSRVGA